MNNIEKIKKIEEPVPLLLKEQVFLYEDRSEKFSSLLILEMIF